MTTENPGPVRRLLARIAWTATPEVGLTYLAEHDALLVDLLPVVTAVEVERWEGVSIGLDGRDEHALPVNLCLLDFTSPAGEHAAKQVRELLGEAVWKRAEELDTSGDVETRFRLTPEDRDDLLHRWRTFAEREFGPVAAAHGELDPDVLTEASAHENYDVFLSFSWQDIDQVVPVERALQEAGLRVFRDSECVDEFDGITAGVVSALASAKVFVAFYSKSYPQRPACQWELTAAFVAAQRDGDPCRRVLAVNPDNQFEHLAPIELRDARYYALHDGTDLHRLAVRVRERADAVTGGLGGLRSRVALIPEAQRSRGFVGRFPDLWRVHSALHAPEHPMMTPATPGAVALVRGMAGAGKTSLVERYAFLFRDAYPGGIFWTGPLPGGRDADEVVARFHAELREIALNTLRLHVTGVERARLRRMVAEHFDSVRRMVLWVVDDVPCDLDPRVLEQLVIPSEYVRTVLTSRGGSPHWRAADVELEGMSTADARALVGRFRPIDECEIGAVDRLVDRVDGNPLALCIAADAVRDRQGVIDDFLEYGPDATSAVGGIVRADLARLSQPATRILHLAAVLGSGPLPGGLVTEVLDEFVGDRRALGDAIAELRGSSLVRWSTDSWRVHSLVTEAVWQTADAGELTEIARAAANVVLTVLRRDGCAPERWADVPISQWRHHARVLGGRPQVPKDDRTTLLRLVSRWHESQGELLTAAALLDEALSVDPANVPNLLEGIEIRIAAGRFEEAVAHAHRAIEIAADDRSAYWARMSLAQALDYLGRYADADEYRVEDTPAWLTADEHLKATINHAVGLRLRGSPKRALDMLTPVVDELAVARPGSSVDDRLSVARLEVCRLRLLTGQMKAARQGASEVIASYQSRNQEHHPRCLEAVGLQAEATLAVDLTELRAKPEQWERSERELRELYAKYERTLGQDNPLTLTAAVQRDRALVSLGRPKQALEALARTEQVVARHLGEEHPLRYRARHAMGLACGQLREFDRQRLILDALLGQQVAALGAYHPDTLETKVDLGIALALTGDMPRGRALVDEAASHLRRAVGWRVDVQMRATTAQMLFRILPPGALNAVVVLEQLFSKKKGQ